MSALPRVSVVIPAYNAAAFIADAIGSVLSQPAPVEVIVVDDGSTDDTAHAAAQFGSAIALISAGRNEGLPSALNRGVARAAGAFIGFVDADDLWEPDRLAWEIPIMTSGRQDALWGMTRVAFLDSEGGAKASPDWPPRHYPALGAMLFRREVFARVGQFDVMLRHGQDIDFMARFAEAELTAERHERVTLCWRRHDSNMTNNVAIDRDYMATAVRRALHRRRIAARTRVEGAG